MNIEGLMYLLNQAGIQIAQMTEENQALRAALSEMQKRLDDDSRVEQPKPK